jgi:hypothetical protein
MLAISIGVVCQSGSRAMNTPKQPQNRSMQNAEASIEKILLRSDRIFSLFIGIGFLAAALILLIMILRWDF